MSVRPNVRSAKCSSANCPFGQMSVGQMSVGQLSGHDWYIGTSTVVGALWSGDIMRCRPGYDWGIDHYGRSPGWKTSLILLLLLVSLL